MVELIAMASHRAEAPLNDAIFQFSTLVFLFPFRADGPRLTLSRKLLAASCIFTIALLMVGLVAIYDFLPRYKGNIFLQGLIFIYMSCYLSIYPCHLIIISIQRKNLETLFRHLKQLYSSLNLSIPSKVIFLSYIDISVVIIWSILLSFTRVPIWYGIYTWIAVGSLPIVCGQFSNLVDIVTDLFDVGLSNLLTLRQRSYENTSKKIEKVMCFANRILSDSVILNDLFSFQMLQIMSVCFWGSCTHLYRIIIGFAYPSEKVNIFTLPHICNFLLCFYSAWRVNHSVTSASSKSQEFNKLLYKLMIDDKTYSALNNDKLRLHISMKRGVVFTACGFFNLGYPLVHSMIASATTYLVILLQFGLPGNVAIKTDPQSFENMTDVTTT